MSLGMKPEWGSRINKAFDFILKACPDFIYAKTQYNNLKCKDLTKNVCAGDVIKKTNAIREYNWFFKNKDILSKKAQDKMMQEKIVVTGNK